MAIFTSGPTVGQISGRIGGSIFSHNRGGPYMRNGTIPTKATSAAAMDAKSRLAAASMAWQGLDTDTMLAWNAYAVQNPAINRLGNKISLTGHQTFVGNFCRCDRAGVSTLTLPPVAESPDALKTLTLNLDVGAGLFDVTYTVTPMAASLHLWLKACVTQSLGVSYYQNLMKLISVTPAAQVSPYDFQDDLEDRWGTLQVGHGVAVDAFVFDSATGLISAPRRAIGVTVTT